MTKKVIKDEYKQTFDSNQKVSGDGSTVIMSNGARFKRTVLPSAAAPPKIQEELQDALADFDAMRTEEK